MPADLPVGSARPSPGGRNARIRLQHEANCVILQPDLIHAGGYGMSKTHNGAIDFLKFVFALVIVAFHFFNYRWNATMVAKPLFPMGIPLPGGYIGVEFFFLVSGFLMAQSANIKSKATPQMRLGSESVQFVIRKLFAILPYYLFSIVASIILCKVFINIDLIPLNIKGLDGLWEILLLQMSGLGIPQMINAQVWYLSAMLISMWIIYPILHKYPDMFLNVIAPLAVLFLLGHLSRKYGTLNVITSKDGFVYPAILRATAEISLGCIAYRLCGKIPNVKTGGKWVLGIAELLCYSIVISLSNQFYKTHADFIMLFFLMIGIIITFSRQSIFTGLFRSRVFPYLGRLSMALFLCHFSLNRIFLTDILKIPIKPLFTVYLACSLALSVVCLLVAEGGKRLWIRCVSRLKTPVETD
jgi:peptidoglycan/LPS O-acetylase OafA/YrhL